MEQWLPLVGYPGYEASDQGRIRNAQTLHVLAICRTNGRPYVGLTKDGIQLKRGLSLLICQTFLPSPREDFNTPIHLDGDLKNCKIDNLVWRPRWFAIQHTEQFRKNLDDTGPVRNLKTGNVYDGVWSVVFNFGVLYIDVVKSIVNKTYVFPLMHCFEWVDPD